VEVTLDVACNMPSFLEIYFSAQNSILLQSIGNRELQVNPDLMIKVVYLMVDILYPIICLKEF
jgi:hypothetical protein